MKTFLLKSSAFTSSIIVGVAILSAPLAFSAAAPASIAVGKACTKAGAVAKVQAGSFKCAKTGTKLVWQAIVHAKTTAAAKPTPSSSAIAAVPPVQSAYDITIATSQWNFAFSYFIDGKKSALLSAPGEGSVLYVPEGKLIHFALTSADTTHGFWVPGLSIDSPADPGTTGHLDFTASKLGTFPGRCNVSSCGRGHAGMAFTVKVVSENDYLKFLSMLKSA